jgi:serine/threonine protein phosphatase PrpC
MIPHPEKAYKGGEDAYFVTNHSVGVSDGVGGWAEQGVDPAIYSNQLMNGAEEAAVKHPGKYTAVELMRIAYDSAKGIIGSATACVAVVSSDQDAKAVSEDTQVLLNLANLGDSGYLTYCWATYSIVDHSIAQQKGFNFPYQLGSQSPDQPEHSNVYDLDLKTNDIVLWATDGVFDNLVLQQMQDLINLQRRVYAQTRKADALVTLKDIEDMTHRNINPNNDKQCEFQNDQERTEFLHGLSVSIAKAASVAGHYTTETTPFTVAAHQEARMHFPGGKLDDITVVTVMPSAGTNLAAKL